jgi:hypothetical protein
VAKKTAITTADDDHSILRPADLPMQMQTFLQCLK